MPGGGTVSYVNGKEHRYLDCPIHREEGGTPDIVGAIRAGLIFQLKESVGHQAIRDAEESYIQRAIQIWSDHPNIQILGNPNSWRLSIVSFMIRDGEQYLHHNFVVAVLNDLFGIQARGDVPVLDHMVIDLLGIDLTTSYAFEQEVLRGCEGIKPGWTRLNFNYFISEETFQFLIQAAELLQRKDGSCCLCIYI